MSIVLFVGFLVLVYFYATEIIIPWHKTFKLKKEISKKIQEIGQQQLDLGSISVLTMGGVNTCLPEGNDPVYMTVAITKPVLLISKRDELLIYHPDNTVEYFSRKGKWKKVKTNYASVYEYAHKMDSIIMENL